MQTKSRSGEPAAVFAALGCETRLALLSRLGDGKDRSITELTGGLDLTRQAVTRHLRVLQQAGIVENRRVGRESRFAVCPDPIGDARDYLTRVSSQWDRSLSRLKAMVEP